MVQLQIYLAPLLDCDASYYLDNSFKARNIYYFRNDLFFLHLLKEISISTCFFCHQILQKDFTLIIFYAFIAELVMTTRVDSQGGILTMLKLMPHLWGRSGFSRQVDGWTRERMMGKQKLIFSQARIGKCNMCHVSERLINIPLKSDNFSIEFL